MPKNKLRSYATVRRGTPRERKVPELTEEEAKNHKLLGTAVGTWPVCWFMGFKYVPDFLDRVEGYRIVKNNVGEILNEALAEKNLLRKRNISVAFYEKPI